MDLKEEAQKLLNEGPNLDGDQTDILKTAACLLAAPHKVPYLKFLALSGTAYFDDTRDYSVTILRKIVARIFEHFKNCEKRSLGPATFARILRTPANMYTFGNSLSKAVRNLSPTVAAQ